MRRSLFIISIICGLTLSSCKKDEVVTCSTCSSPATLSFELCKEGDGNASVNGENTGIPYDTYLMDLEETGVSCGL